MQLLLSLLFSFSFTLEQPQSEIPKNGTYIYEVAFAEWSGRTMGDEVIVILKDGHITLKVSNNSNILWMGAASGDVIEEGTLRKHQSGVWIISNDEKDVSLEEIGGCTGGPTVIDFDKQTIEMC
ncbi:hypothetical protein N9O54_00270 [Schleiferiaceae bacterium]|nr:hypothetical protein [Schleiferiaceae bacterium]MDA8564893.1 hypothetical protein [Schleiferiaceae bacterium]MDA9191491.1 hypothetical protein [Schleiferiaceae bacterium]